MSDDYLWDGTGPPDPDVERLEKMLGRLRHDRPAPRLPAGKPSRETRPRRRWPIVLAAAAVLAVGVVGLELWRRAGRPFVEVTAIEGAPRIGSRTIAAVGRLAVGDRLETDESSKARIEMGMIGEVLVDPRTRLALVAARVTEQRLALERGTIHARIWAPPRLFSVDTPSATAVDLGCAYTLEVDDLGEGLLRVSQGWVAFHLGDREVFVPAGAACGTRPGDGPGTPYREGASEELRAALERFDFDHRAPAEARQADLEVILEQARATDGLTLWHLLSRTTPEERAKVYTRLSELVPPPEGVTREAVMAGDREALDRWWDELGLRSASFWRLWEGSWPPRTQ